MNKKRFQASRRFMGFIGCGSLPWDSGKIPVELVNPRAIAWWNKRAVLLARAGAYRWGEEEVTARTISIGVDHE